MSIISIILSVYRTFFATIVSKRSSSSFRHPSLFQHSTTMTTKVTQTTNQKNSTILSRIQYYCKFQEKIRTYTPKFIQVLKKYSKNDCTAVFKNTERRHIEYALYEYPFGAGSKFLEYFVSGACNKQNVQKRKPPAATSVKRTGAFSKDNMQCCTSPPPPPTTLASPALQCLQTAFFTNARKTISQNARFRKQINQNLKRTHNKKATTHNET